MNVEVAIIKVVCKNTTAQTSIYFYYDIQDQCECLNVNKHTHKLYM